uniref:Uncharacterized protein n=1 Tax=Cacopsylla melanoneura TaxID=428564 RepID=A0A8D9F4E0_9HEMI
MSVSCETNQSARVKSAVKAVSQHAHLSIDERARRNPIHHADGQRADHVLVLDKHVQIGTREEACHGRPDGALQVEPEIVDGMGRVHRGRKAGYDCREKFRNGHTVNITRA